MLCLTARFQDQVRRFPLPHEVASIGYSSENDIVLPFHGVSRRHALLTQAGSAIVLTDTGSKNGLILDGARVPSLTLAIGTRVQIGSAVLAIEDADTSELEIALTARGRERGLRSTRTDSVAERSTDAAVLELVSAIERRGSARQHAQAILTEAREVLGAATMTLIEERDGDHALLALTGNPMPAGVLIDASQRLHRQREVAEDVYRHDGATVMLSGAMRKGRGLLLLARFEGPPRAILSSERTLFGYLASKFRSALRGRDPLPATPDHPRGHGIVYASRQMHTLMETVRSIAATEHPILIHGETGTGKELVARLLHASGPYSGGRLLAVNCAEIPAGLVESELFGVERGVATGVEARQGLFAAADGGTLFLDEVGELPQSTQALLLRVLERREVRPVGSRSTRPVRLRVVLATRRDIGDDAVSGIRQDLFFRCLFLSVPPLRERRDDVIPLTLHFLERTCLETGIVRSSISEKAIRLLMTHEWPGNVRELEHAVEQAVLRFGRGGILQSEHFASVLRSVRPAGITTVSNVSLRAEREHLDRARVEDALRSTRGNKSGAARLLGMSRNGLAKLMARLGLTGR